MAGEEKPTNANGTPVVALVVDEELEAKKGYTLDAALYDNDNLKLAEDGRTVLIPQPSDDPEDPLNWTRKKKLAILFTMSTIAFLPEFGSAVGIPAIVPQTMEWNASANAVQQNLVANLVCLAGGALIAIVLSNYFGRLPILFAFHTVALGTGIWNAAAQTLPSYIASRAINGVFSIVAAGAGLMWIKDMFFLHQHPRMINLWSGGIVVAPYISPMMEAFITWKADWRWGFLVYSILNLVGWVMITVFADETWYDRRAASIERPVKKSKVKRLLGIEQRANMRANGPTFAQAVARPFIAISKLPVLLAVIYYFLNFAWVIGVNTTTAIWLTSIYEFDGRDLGLFYIAGILGSIVGEVAGHWMHDSVGNFFMKRRGGRIDPEVRLYISYLSSVLMAVALVVLGFALERTWHYMIVAVFYGVQVAGIMIATTAVNAFLLDAYPEGSGEVGAWVVFGRVFGGFMATYINIPWVLSAGASTVFAIQAGITIAAALIVVFLQLFGKRLRKAQDAMVFRH